jgi:hypothetical protein
MLTKSPIHGEVKFKICSMFTILGISVVIYFTFEIVLSGQTSLFYHGFYRGIRYTMSKTVIWL